MILEKIKKIYYRKIGKYLIKDIGRLEWNPKDFDKGKRWAMSREHPNNPKLSLWDYLKSYGDSLLIIDEINKINNYK